LSITKVSAATMRPASIQYRAGLPLNRKAEATMANAKTSDQRMRFLSLGFIYGVYMALSVASG
jgi:hypothetical protein